MKKMSNKNKFINAVKKIPMTAQKGGWVLTLDTEENALFYSPVKIPEGSELHQVTDEYALYLDKNFNPQGVMIEYYDQNFIKHHKAFKKLSNSLFSGQEKVKVADPNSKDSTENTAAIQFAALLEYTLIKEAGTRVSS
jgi:hypothetical protein